MEKIKKLPEILITGKTQDLIEIETLLVMAGYNKPDENYNNTIISEDNPRKMKCYEDGTLSYFNFISYSDDGMFEAKEVDKILNFIETYSNTK